MNLTTDKLRSMVKKWQTLIEGNVDVKTTDGYMLRLFCIGFTRKQDLSTKKTCYAQSAQVKNIRKKMIDIIQREVSTTDLKEVVNKLIPDSIARDIEKACQGIYPLHDVHIRKVKVMTLLTTSFRSVVLTSLWMMSTIFFLMFFTWA